MYRCNGCNRKIATTERFIEAALEYRFCMDCVTISSLREELASRQLLLQA